MAKYDPVDFCGELKHETDAAYLVFDGANNVWIPKSQIQDCHQIKGSDWEFVIPEWLAKEKGII
jgi:hypothetical protein